jgi:hypothetical protein
MEVREMQRQTTRTSTTQIRDFVTNLRPAERRRAVCHLAGLPAMPEPLTEETLLTALLRKMQREDPAELADLIKRDPDRRTREAIRHACEAATPNPLDVAFAAGVMRGVRKAHPHR